MVRIMITDVRYLPNKIKDAVIEKLEHYDNDEESWSTLLDDMKKWLRTTPDDHEQLQHSFMEFNNKIDQVRKEKFSSTFPEYSKLFV
jgi:hypothetical protein